MVLIFIFANIIDATHFGIYRILLHNPLGTVSFTLIWLIVFQKLKIIDKGGSLVLLLSTVVHVLLDILFSEYSLLYPFSTTTLSIYGINSFEQLVTGSISGIVFTIVLVLSKDFLAVKQLLNTKKKDLFGDLSIKKMFNPSFFVYYMFVIYYLFIIAQFIFFLYIFDYVLLQSVWYVNLFFITFIILLCVLTALFFDISRDFSCNSVKSLKKGK
jgi:hypothetical protein